MTAPATTATTKNRTPGLARFVNPLMNGMVRVGVAPHNFYLLTVRGRRSGKPRSTPVTLLDFEGERYLLSLYGEVHWVRNVRAAVAFTLRRGRQREEIAPTELHGEEAARVLQAALAIAPGMMLKHFDVEPQAPLEEFVAEAPRHPVFRLSPKTTAA